VWAKIRSHWRERLDAEQARGKSNLLRGYDEAYVTQLETERGPITPTEYARLTVAAERGSAEEALAALNLPPTGLPRVQRVWMRRMIDDGLLAKQVREAINRLLEEEP
jgi:hypothetical protein